jgi:hypothetical protein
MSVENEHLKAACLLVATQAYKDIHHQEHMTPEQGHLMQQRVIRDAAALYDRWLEIEAERKANGTSW